MRSITGEGQAFFHGPAKCRCLSYSKAHASIFFRAYRLHSADSVDIGENMKKFIGFFLLCTLVQAGLADVFYLSDGRAINGKLRKVKDGTTLIQTPTGIVRVKTSDIVKIEVPAAETNSSDPTPRRTELTGSDTLEYIAWRMALRGDRTAIGVGAAVIAVGIGTIVFATSTPDSFWEGMSDAREVRSRLSTGGVFEIAFGLYLLGKGISSLSFSKARGKEMGFIARFRVIPIVSPIDLKFGLSLGCQMAF